MPILYMLGFEALIMELEITTRKSQQGAILAGRRTLLGIKATTLGFLCHCVTITTIHLAFTMFM